MQHIKRDSFNYPLFDTRTCDADEAAHGVLCNLTQSSRRLYVRKVLPPATDFVTKVYKAASNSTIKFSTSQQFSS